MSGIEKIPLRIPAQWDPKWFQDFVRDVLAKADARNVIAEAGFGVTGNPAQPATMQVHTQKSLTVDAGGIRLVADEESPGALTFYGTDAGGAKGFHSLPASGIGDVSGPASAVDGEIALFNGTTGKAIKRAATTGMLKASSGVLAAAAAGTDYVAPGAATGSALTMATARLLGRTTASTGAIEEISVGRGLDLSGGTLSQATAWLMQTADYTLTNTTSLQQIFNQTANGRLTLPTGVYAFEGFLYLLDMDATSGNVSLDMLGAGTATTDRWGWQIWGLDANSPLGAGNITGSASVSNSRGPAVAATTGTGLMAMLRGMFRVSAAGTLIPSLSLDTAAAATVKAGSWLQVAKVGESVDSCAGAWD